MALRQVQPGPDGELTFLHSDHLGSTSAWTGSETGRQAYYPYGMVRATEGTLPTEVTFTGQRVDRSTAQNPAGTDGLLYYGARYYDSALGRWTQPDTIVPDPLNPQTLNRYAYVYNNPVRYDDPDGHDAGCGGRNAAECKGGSLSAQLADLRTYVDATGTAQVLQVDLTKYPKTNQYSLDRQQYGFNACGLVAAASAVDPVNWKQVAQRLYAAAGDEYNPNTGIQPHALAEAYRQVFGKEQVVEHNEWTLEGMMDALAHGKMVVVDLQVRKVDKNTAAPSTEHKNYSHFARVLGIDTRGEGAVYLQNTVEGAPYWKVTIAEFYKVWLSPEMEADPPAGLKREDMDPATRWGVEF